MQKKIKGVIQAEGNEEKKQTERLENEKLSELSEEELREAFDRFSPQSDWERLFADKIDYCEIKNPIETVRSMRNDIAHCKFFTKINILLSTKRSVF